jgi:hypothetical protein
MRFGHSYSGSPYGLLIFGCILLLLAVVGAYRGQIRERSHVFYYAKEPKQFWLSVAIHFLGGIFLIAYFIYKVT